MTWGIEKCEICGVEFEKAAPNHKYCCKACARTANCEKKRIEYQCKGKSPKPVKKRNEKSILSVLAAEARKKRMSYGQYIGMIEMPNLIERVCNE